MHVDTSLCPQSLRLTNDCVTLTQRTEAAESRARTVEVKLKAKAAALDAVREQLRDHSADREHAADVAYEQLAAEDRR